MTSLQSYEVLVFNTASTEAGLVLWWSTYPGICSDGFLSTSVRFFSLVSSENFTSNSFETHLSRPDLLVSFINLGYLHI